MTTCNVAAQTAGPPSGYAENTPSTSACQENSVFRYKNHKRNCTFKVYPHCVEYFPPSIPVIDKFTYCTKRGAIYEFSKRSRFRMFQLMAKLKTKLTVQPFFVSLTYHYGFSAAEDIHVQHFHNFLTQLRLFDEHVQYIWRLEFQKRGAPHFHLIIFPSNFIKPSYRPTYEAKVSSIWHSISNPDSKAHERYGCKITSIKNYSMACAYISKYAAKVDESTSTSTKGKQWGCSRNLPIDLRGSVDCNKSQTHYIIESIRRWLIKNGRSQYATDEYFNEYRPQVIFIDENEFWKLNDECRVIPSDWKKYPAPPVAFLP